MARALTISLAVLLSSSTAALAAGFGLKEHSAEAMGSAYAGAAASSSAQALYYNPASLAGVVDNDVSFSLVEILPTSSARYTTATTSVGTQTGGAASPGNFIGDAPIPNLAVRHRLSDDWTVGLSISAPYGLKTNYPAGWAGRYYATKTSLVTVDIAPSIAYQVTPTLSLGASLEIEYARGQLGSAIDIGTLGASLAIPGSVPGALDGSARLSAMDWSEGFTVGAIDQVTPDLTLGLAYQSAIHHRLGGPLTFTLDAAGLGAAIRGATGLFTNTRASAAVTTPDMILAGARWQLDDRWTALAEMDWTNWSQFQNLTIVAQNPAQPNDVTDGRWHNTLFGSLGLEYLLDDSWKLRGGVGYDESPIPDATRNPRIPDADRVWLAAGAAYRFTPSSSLNFSVGELFNSDESVALNPTQTGNALRGSLAGTTRSSVTTVGLQFTTAF
jgi:long-chain fatty acid transport protein